MSKSIEIGIIIIPDEKTQEEAAKLQAGCLGQLAHNKLIDRHSYQENYPNNFHITFYQLRIIEKDLPPLISAIREVAKDVSQLSFKMNNIVKDTQRHLFWGSDEAKNLTGLKELHGKIIEKAKNFRHSTEPFSRADRGLKKFTNEQCQDIKEFGIFWGLAHNFDPHITIVYDSGEDRDGVNIQKSIAEIKTSYPNHSFYGKSIAIGKLGPAGNVTDIVSTIKQLEPSSSFGDHKIFSNSGKNNPNKSNSQTFQIISQKRPISKL